MHVQRRADCLGNLVKGEDLALGLGDRSEALLGVRRAQHVRSQSRVGPRFGCQIDVFRSYLFADVLVSN